jgi:hypothetical protein
MAARKKPAPEGSGPRFMPAHVLRPIFGAAAPGAIDSRALVEYALQFINGNETLAEPDPGLAEGQPFLQPETLQATRESWRGNLRQFAATFRKSRAAAIQSLPEFSFALHSISGMAKFEATSARLEFNVPINSPEAFRMLFALVLADDAQPFGRALCRCRLKSCGQFFLEQKPRTGRPQRLYCSREHMLAAHSARER